MQINTSLRIIIPTCSMLLALGTVAFQSIEDYSKKEQKENIHQIEVQQQVDLDGVLLIENEQ
ncbi:MULTISPECIES: hypothetical protein [Nonlabens]|uniref:Uncharacterized protein n=2 Tax=Nonlabens ulvanivorans TaxID=906888 RepID=A0A084JVQ3_NONUL|nr:hypothetical protein [Nonlabens ulvanivorans]KEZ93037.1 hypothetical protein IL45_12985 [Nonlabens ulvanivorans]PRX12733.1 hypothetical protein LY02_02385 [Nonlabens ulvanivorans]WOI24100.1 hypothetical protein R1T42_06525 [Nonlabens ulvanivorans]